MFCRSRSFPRQHKIRGELKHQSALPASAMSWSLASSPFVRAKHTVAVGLLGPQQSENLDSQWLDSMAGDEGGKGLSVPPGATVGGGDLKDEACPPRRSCSEPTGTLHRLRLWAPVWLADGRGCQDKVARHDQGW